MHISIEGASFWLELKSQDRTALCLRPQQAAWHLREAACGGLSYVLSDFPRSPYLKIWRGSDGALTGSAGLLCVPALIEADTVADALRLLFADALRLRADQSLASARLSGSGTEKAPDT